MKAEFLCPNCRGYLNVGNRIVFTIKKKDWNGGLLLLSPELGEYSYQCHESHQFEKGEQLEFHCPICQYDLSVKGAEKLARVLLHENDDDEFYVVFSKVKGEKCTYKISEKKVEKSYGEHNDENIDLLNMAYLK